MNRQKLQADFEWQRWKSTTQDTSRLQPLLGSRLLFEILLINTFENELLRLKNSDCVWGPVHSSVGQEAVAAAPMAAISRRGGTSTGNPNRSRSRAGSRGFLRTPPPVATRCVQ